jgi:hypothetical protein
MKMFALPLALLLLSFSPDKIEKKAIYYPNGNKHFEYEVASGLLHGPVTAYFENGRIKLQGQLKNNQKTGKWTAWDEKGTKRSERLFFDDYSFEIINEWNAEGKPIDPVTLQQKKERLMAARSKTIAEKHSIYVHRFWKEIGPGEAANNFLFEGNSFYNFLITQACNKTMNVYSDDRGISKIADYELLKSYRNGIVTGYKLKEELIFTRDKEIMHTVVFFINPTISINGETKEVGWFYIPFIRDHRQATEAVEEIVTKLEKRHYSGTISKTTINANGKESRDVQPGDSDLYLLTPIEYEAQTWIYYIDKQAVAK